MQLPILCAVVVNRDKSGFTIVASYPSKDNFEYENILLDAIKDINVLEDEKFSIMFDKFVVHILVGELLYYACITSAHQSDAAKIAFLVQNFLDRVRSIYSELPILADLSNELHNNLTIDLSAPLEKLSITYDYHDAVLPLIHSELAEVRKVLLESVQKFIDRGQKLDELVKKTQCLEIRVHKDFLLTPRSTKKKKNMFFAFLVSIAILSSLAFGILVYIEFI